MLLRGMGIRHEPDLVCSACFSDPGLIDFVEKNKVLGLCSFCAGHSVDAHVASFQEVADYIKLCLYQEYDDPANCMGYDGAEGGYQGLHWPAQEFLFSGIGLDFPQDADEKLADAVIDHISDHDWCEANPYGLNDTEVARFSWEHFCKVVTHQRRFFFADYPGSPDREIYSPATVLAKLFEYAENYDLFIPFPAGTQLFRARFQGCGVQLETAQDLGPPPEERATQSNRMNPPGIPMFYAGENKETALRETANGPGPFVVGCFETCRAAVLLDLTKVPATPSLFQEIPDRLEYRPREVLGFLNHIIREMSKPIERDDRVHIEYVPTQVVTEYIRSKLLHERTRIDGIKYPSAAHPGHSSYVLFATQDNLLPQPPNADSLWYPPDEDRWLELTGRSECLVTQEQFELWKEV